MLEIRLASRKDADSLTALGYESYIGHFGHLWPEKQALADFLADDFAAPSLEKSFAEPHCHWLIASVDGQDVGLAKLLCEMPRLDTGALGGQLKKIYFLREFTGRGYGRALFSAVEMLAREARQTQLWLEVLPQNHQAKAFYLSQQMAVSGETAYERESRYTPLLILSKAL
ncbi:hypothetical protein BK025_14535 [Sodalis sp. TME1]|nr:hypothetical protein BK025_14535 [Sodalis sp. TME1]